jgi:hypothetical protein
MNQPIEEIRTAAPANATASAVGAAEPQTDDVESPATEEPAAGAVANTPDAIPADDETIDQEDDMEEEAEEEAGEEGHAAPGQA